MQPLVIQAIEGLPMVTQHDDLADLIINALASNQIKLSEGDILVIAQKIVSKAEGRFVNLGDVTPGQAAIKLAKKVAKDPRMIELVLAESKSVIRQVPGVLITEHNRGWIMANAGIDGSNVSADAQQETVLLLPVDPDQSSEKLRTKIKQALGVDVGIVISDSFGRPWRLGTMGIAIGAAGVTSLWDRRGGLDLFGKELQVTQQAIADELAAAASLLQGQGAEGRPVVLIRGLELDAENPPVPRPAADLIRVIEEDLFR